MANLAANASAMGVPAFNYNGTMQNVTRCADVSLDWISHVATHLMHATCTGDWYINASVATTILTKFPLLGDGSIELVAPPGLCAWVCVCARARQCGCGCMFGSYPSACAHQCHGR